MKKKVISLLLVLALMAGICPAALAEEILTDEPQMIDIELETTDDHIIIVSIPEDKADEYRYRLENDPEFRQSEIETALASMSPTRYRPEGNIVVERYMYATDIQKAVDACAGVNQYASYMRKIGKLVTDKHLLDLIGLAGYKAAIDLGITIFTITIQIGATKQESWWRQAESDLCNGDISAVCYLLIESVVEYPKAWKVFEIIP